MLELIQLCFAPINLIFTMLMVCVMAYWSMFVIGFVGLDMFDDLDIDIDADVDLDVDLDVDVDADLDLDADVDVDLNGEVEADANSTGSGRAGWFISLLKFMNIGDVPLMILISSFITALWVVSIVSSYYFNPALSVMIALVSFIPDFFLSLLLTKVMTIPAAAIFKQANAGVEKRTRIIGRTCIVTTSRVTDKSGQAEIRPEDAAPITLNVRCRSGSKHTPLHKGDEALILELVEEKGTYIVVPFDLEVN